MINSQVPTPIEFDPGSLGSRRYSFFQTSQVILMDRACRLPFGKSFCRERAMCAFESKNINVSTNGVDVGQQNPGLIFLYFL